MAISVTHLTTQTGTTFGDPGSGGSNLSITVPAGGVPSGACLFVGLTIRNNPLTNLAITDSASNSYSNITSRALNNSTVNGWLTAWRAENVSTLSSGNTITVSTTDFSAAHVAASVFYATGINISSPLDGAVTAVASGNNSTPSVTSGTPAESGELFIGFLGTRGNTTYTQDSGNGWATPPNDAASAGTTAGARIDGGNQVNAGTGTLTFAPTLSGANVWATIICGFKPSSGTTTNKSISVIQGQTVARVNVTRKLIAVTSAATISLLRAVNAIRSVTQGQTVSVRRLIGKAPLAVVQAMTASALKSVGKVVAASAVGQAVSATTLKASPVIAAAVSAQAITVARSIGRIIAVTFAQVASVRRAVSVRIAAVTQAISTTVIKSVRISVATSLAQSAAVIRAVGKRVSVVSAQSAAVTRAAGKIVAVTQAQTVSALRRLAFSRIIAVTSAQTVVAMPRKAARLVVAASHGMSVAVFRTIRKVVIAVSQGGNVEVIRVRSLVTKVISSLSAGLVTLVRPSALRHWPSDVPSYALIDGYDESMEGNAVSFTPEVGPPKWRRLFSTSSEVLSFSILMTAAQYASFLTFYRSTLKDGTKPFTMTHPRLQTTVTMRFMDKPQIADAGPDSFRVSLKMRKSA